MPVPLHIMEPLRQYLLALSLCYPIPTILTLQLRILWAQALIQLHLIFQECNLFN